MIVAWFTLEIRMLMIPFIEVLVFREVAFELKHHPWEDVS